MVKTTALAGLSAALLQAGSAQAAMEVANIAASDNRFGTIALLALPVLGVRTRGAGAPAPAHTLPNRRALPAAPVPAATLTPRRTLPPSRARSGWASTSWAPCRTS